GRRAARELLDGGAVLELLVDVARLARLREAAEARAAGADAPRRDRDLERLRALRQRLDVGAAPLQTRAELGEVAREVGGGLRILLGHELRIDDGPGHARSFLSALHADIRVARPLGKSWRREPCRTRVIRPSPCPPSRPPPRPSPRPSRSSR